MFGATMTMQEMARRDKVRAVKAAAMRAWRAANPERAKANSRRFYERNKDKVLNRTRERKDSINAYQRSVRRDPATWGKTVLKVIRHKCLRRGIEFDLTWQDVAVPSVCPVTLRPFAFGDHSLEGPSIDRMDPTKGYVRGNVRVISRLANAIKNNCTDPETFRRVALYVEGKL